VDAEEELSKILNDTCPSKILLIQLFFDFTSTYWHLAKSRKPMAPDVLPCIQHLITGVGQSRPLAEAIALRSRLNKTQGHAPPFRVLNAEIMKSTR